MKMGFRIEIEEIEKRREKYKQVVKKAEQEMTEAKNSTLGIVASQEMLGEVKEAIDGLILNHHAPILEGMKCSHQLLYMHFEALLIVWQ